VVIPNGAGLPGVSVKLFDGIETITDSNGDYFFKDIVDGSYTITPSKPGFNFTPAVVELTIVGRDARAENIVCDGFVTNSITLVSIPGGTFLMGDTEGNGYRNEIPVHYVTLSSFYMSACEITQWQYKNIMTTDQTYTSPEGNNVAVNGVSWYEAVKFCNMLSEDAGLQKCYDESTWLCDFTKNGFRLPTEAEWEFACRGGKQYAYGTDDGTISMEKTNYSKYYGMGIGYTVDVGSYPPNPFGLYDMSGNVWEWCNDWYETYSKENLTDPTGPLSGTFRIIRGGCYASYDFSCRSAVRGYAKPYTLNVNGLRVVRR